MDARAINRQIRGQLDSITAADAAWCKQPLAAVQQRLKKRQPVGLFYGDANMSMSCLDSGNWPER